MFKIPVEDIIEEYFEFRTGVRQKQPRVEKTLILTYDRTQAIEVMKDIYDNADNTNIECFRMDKNKIELRFTNGNSIIWLNPESTARGYKFTKILVDRNMKKKDLLRNLDIWAIFCCKDDISVI